MQSTHLSTTNSSTALPLINYELFFKICHIPGQKQLNLCTQCGIIEEKEADLRTHMMCHTGEKPYACKMCNKSYTSKKHLTRHEKSHSHRTKPTAEATVVTISKPPEDPPQNLIHCAICLKALESSQTYQQHLRSNHTRQECNLFPYCKMLYEVCFICESQQGQQRLFRLPRHWLDGIRENVLRTARTIKDTAMQKRVQDEATWFELYNGHYHPACYKRYTHIQCGDNLFNLQAEAVTFALGRVMRHLEKAMMEEGQVFSTVEVREMVLQHLHSQMYSLSPDYVDCCIVPTLVFYFGHRVRVVQKGRGHLVGPGNINGDTISARFNAQKAEKEKNTTEQHNSSETDASKSAKI